MFHPPPPPRRRLELTKCPSECPSVTPAPVLECPFTGTEAWQLRRIESPLCSTAQSTVNTNTNRQHGACDAAIGAGGGGHAARRGPLRNPPTGPLPRPARDRLYPSDVTAVPCSLSTPDSRLPVMPPTTPHPPTWGPAAFRERRGRTPGPFGASGARSDGAEGKAARRVPRFPPPGQGAERTAESSAIPQPDAGARAGARSQSRS